MDRFHPFRCARVCPSGVRAMYPVRLTQSDALLTTIADGRCDFVVDHVRQVIFIDSSLSPLDQQEAEREARARRARHHVAFVLVPLYQQARPMSDLLA